MISIDFFWVVQEKSASTMIFCLLDEHGNEVRKPQRLGDLCTQFYWTQYTEQSMTLVSNAVMDSILDSVAPRLPPDAYHKLNESISLLKLGNAAKELACGHSPRHDGQTIGFYVKLWLIIALDFHYMILDAIRFGELLVRYFKLTTGPEVIINLCGILRIN